MILNNCRDFVQERSLTVLVEAAQRLNIDVKVEELAPTRFKSGDETVVPTTEYQSVLGKIFSDPRETLGIELAQMLPVQALGLWGFLLRSSPTFGAMLRRAERYSRIFFRFTHISLERGEQQITLICDHPDPSPFGKREQEICYFLGQWLTLGRSLIGDAVVVKNVKMRWSGPVDAQPFEKFFGCGIHFGESRDALIFDGRVFDLPMPEYTPELGALFEGYASALIQRMDHAAGFVDQVREALTEGLLDGKSDETAVAEQLNITHRTLRRRLAEEGLHFRDIRQDLMRTRAQQLLSENRLPIAEIAYLLGYADPSTFHRAFRNWTGWTPGEWREKHEE